jgi:type 1 glutamine amidotransferase
MARVLLPLLIAATGWSQNTGTFFQPGKIRALIISGRNNHDWRATTPLLRRQLVNTGKFDVRVTEEPSGITGQTVEAYDVLILDYNGPRWGQTAERAVEDFVKAGKGLVLVHGASYGFGEMELLGDRHVKTGIHEDPWSAFVVMAGGNWFAKTGHGRRHVFTVKYTDREHPIARGLPETFLTSDELYHRMNMRPEAHVIATAFSALETGGTGRDEPILWTVGYGKGRVFQTVLGHDTAAMMEPGFAESFTCGAEWAATGAVKPFAGTKKEAPIRVLVVTGGHGHAPDFYSVFTGQDDLATTVNPHPDAFGDDIRKAYDVLVLYDMYQDVPEVQRKNLRDFVESGKGVVILHHALASLNDWPWWWEDVRAGKYLLKEEGGRAASTYKHDQALVAQPTGKHPITDGIGAIHIIDETYKGVWISPGARILLKTNHPMADGPLMWVSPYEKSRIVYCMLGHGPEAHNHPQFRQLIHNAVRWVADR